MPVSRDSYLPRIFAQLELLHCDSEKTSLLVLVDGDVNLFSKVRNYVVNSKFHQRLCEYRRKGVPNVGSVKRRRQRIADIHNEVKQYIDNADYLFLIEDDTLIPTTALDLLLNDFDFYSYAGIISGIEIGRWGYTHIGAWTVDDIYDPKKITSIKLGEELEPVDATGLYCCLVKKENYMSHNFAPLLDILGPDVNFGIELRKMGLQNYVDHRIKCEHLTKRGAITFINSEIEQVQLSLEDNKWKQGKI